jgi:predicted PurR-regulated permease PerM
MHTGCISLSRRSPLPSPTLTPTEKTRSAVRGAILFAVAVLLALALAWRLREVITLIYISALFAVVLMPVVNRIMSFQLHGTRHVSRAVAIMLLLSCVFLAIVLFFLVALPPVIRNLHQFAEDLPARIPPIVARLKSLPLADMLGVDTIAQRSEDALSATAAFLLASFPEWMGRFFDLLTAFVLCVYFMLEGEYAYRWLMSLFSVEHRLRLAVTLQKAERRISKWLFGQALLMLILGLTSTLVFGLLHVRYFILLGVLMGLMNCIPIAGGVITILLVGLVAALDSWTKMAAVFLFYAIYVNVENAYLTPRIMRQSVNLMGLTVLIALIAGTELAGIVGALVAVPTAALLAVLMEEYLVQKDIP